VEIYEWLHKRKFKLYPMELVMAERKLKYFGMVVREGIKSKRDLASKIFWSDVRKKCTTWKDMIYEHVRDIKEALKILCITEEEANNTFTNRKVWEKKLEAQKKGTAYEKWKVERERIREERKTKEKENRREPGREEQGREYTRRPLI
jgi:hypothetical protein